MIKGKQVAEGFEYMRDTEASVGDMLDSEVLMDGSGHLIRLDERGYLRKFIAEHNTWADAKCSEVNQYLCTTTKRPVSAVEDRDYEDAAKWGVKTQRTLIEVGSGTQLQFDGGFWRQQANKAPIWSLSTGPTMNFRYKPLEGSW